MKAYQSIEATMSKLREQHAHLSEEGLRMKAIEILNKLSTEAEKLQGDRWTENNMACQLILQERQARTEVYLNNLTVEEIERDNIWLEMLHSYVVGMADAVSCMEDTPALDIEEEKKRMAKARISALVSELTENIQNAHENFKLMMVSRWGALSSVNEMTMKEFLYATQGSVGLLTILKELGVDVEIEKGEAEFVKDGESIALTPRAIEKLTGGNVPPEHPLSTKLFNFYKRTIALGGELKESVRSYQGQLTMYEYDLEVLEEICFELTLI